MFKFLLIICTSILLITSFGFSQTPVAPGDGTLNAAIAAANSGDVLVLQDGGLYTESVDTFFVLDKVLTIKAEDGATTRPVIEIHTIAAGDTVTPDVFLMLDGSGLTLDFIELNGLRDDVTYKSIDSFFEFEDTQDATIAHLKFYNSYIHGCTDEFVNGNGSNFDLVNMVVDSIIVKNCLFTNGNGIQFKQGNVMYIEMENTTMWNVGNRAVRSQKADTELHINHCTFDNIGFEGEATVFFKGITPPVAEVKNCIFTNTDANSDVVRIDGGNGVLHHSDFYMTGPIDLDGGTPTDTMSVDPLYTDAANGNFMLPNNSPVVGQADDGMAMGDLRWDPTASPIEPGTDGNIIPNFLLGQNFPNPFNPNTTIPFSVDHSGIVTITIYNILGQDVGVVLHKFMDAGNHQVNLNAELLPSGIYLYKLESGGQVLLKKMVLLK